MSSMQQAVHFARAGMRVAWVGLNHGHADRDLSEMADMVAGDDDVRRISRANGRARIDFHNGGKVVAVAVHGNGQRAHSLDVAYLPDWELIRDDAFMSKLLSCFATTGKPRIGVIV